MSNGNRDSHWEFNPSTLPDDFVVPADVVGPVGSFRLKLLAFCGHFDSSEFQQLVLFPRRWCHTPSLLVWLCQDGPRFLTDHCDGSCTLSHQIVEGQF